jgi:hypothetical protein
MVVVFQHEKARRFPVLDRWIGRYISQNMLRGSVYFNDSACGYRAISSTTFAVSAAEATGSAVTATTAACYESAVSATISVAVAASTFTTPTTSSAVAVAATKSTPERAWRCESVATTCTT